MAIIKTYPLKNNYYGPDRLVLSDMQPDSLGIVHGNTKNITMSNLKSFIGSQVIDVSASTTDRYKGAFVSPSTGNVKVGIDLLPLTMLLAPNGFDYLLVTDDPSGNPINKKTSVDNFFSSAGLITNSSINYTVKLPNTVGGASQVLQLPSVIGSSPHQLEWSTPAGSGTVIGTGNTNYIPKWNSSTELTDSIVYENGTNIGIGTTNPSFKLEVINTIGVSGLRPIRMNSGTGAVDIRGSGVGGWANAYNFNGSLNTVLGGFGCLGLGDGMNYWYIGSAYNNTTMVIKPNNGNVGIGTTVPSEKLEVQGKIKITGTDAALQLYRNSSTQSNYIKFYDNVTSSNEALVGYTSNNKDFKVSNLSSNGTVTFQSGGGGAGGGTVRLSATGNLGIGTTAPAAKLDILDTINQTAIRVTNNNYDNYLIQKRRTDNTQILGIQEFGSNGGLALVTAGAQRLNINNLGNVGIGTTAPTSKFQVNGLLQAEGINSLYIGTLTTATAMGWYRAMEWTGSSRGGSVICLSITGGSFSPVTYVIKAYKTFGLGVVNSTLKLEQYGESAYITKARITWDSSVSKAFVEVYKNVSGSIPFNMHQDKLIGYDATSTVLVGTAAVGSGQVMEELPFTLDGTSVENLTSRYATLYGDGTTNAGKLKFNCYANSHNVEIVGPDHSGGTSYSLKLPNFLPSVSNQILESNALGVLSWIPTPSGGGGGGGTVTSVGLSAPPAFSIGNSPITGSGTISLGVTGGTAGQYLDYLGNWSTPTNTGTIVVGNPTTGASAVLTGISIGSTVYSIPQGTGTGNIASVTGQNGLSGSGSSGSVFIDNIDRGTDQKFYSTIITDNGTDVDASSGGAGVNDKLTLTGGTGMVTAGSPNKVSIALSQATNLLRGGLNLGSNVGLTSINVSGTDGTGINNRVYPLQLNGSGQAGVYVPWTGGSGSGINFSGTTVGGLATFTNSSTAGVSSKITLNANGVMQFDSDNALGVNYSRASIDYNPTGNRMQLGDFTSNQGGIVEFYTNGSRGFQIGINGELGLGTTASQGTVGQVLTSGGNGAEPTWTTSSSAGSNGSSGVIQLSNGSGGFASSTNLFWETISGTKGRLVIGKPSNNIDREGILKLLGGPNTSGGGVGGTIELQAAVGKSANPPAITKIQAPVSNSTAQEIILPSALPTATTQVLGIDSITGSEVATKWVTSSGGGVTQTIIPWNATLARTDGTSYTELNAAGAIRSDAMVITDNNCFATIQGNVVNYQFYIRGYFQGNTEAGGQYLPITGPLFLARCQNADGSGTVSGIPIEASQSTTVIDNRFANGSLTVTEDPFATLQAASTFGGTVPTMNTYWKLPIRGGKVGRAYTGATTLPGFVQLFTSAAPSDNKVGREWSTCKYPTSSNDVWYYNDFEYMPENKGYDFVFAGTIVAFVTQS